MTCEACSVETDTQAVTVADIPMVMILCNTCIAHGAIPYDMLVLSAWLRKGKLTTSDYNVAIYLGYTAAEFESDVANYIDKVERDLTDSGF